MGEEALGAEIEGLGKLIRNTRPELLADPLRGFFNRSAQTVRDAAKIGGPVDVGRLRSSLTFKVDSANVPLWAEVGTNVKYAKPVEFGTGILSEAPDSRRRRYFPPPSALEVWASRHGFPSGFFVALLIFRRGGTRPRRFLQTAFKDSIGAIDGFLKRASSEIGRDWTS